jgi:hypothetical protein
MGVYMRGYRVVFWNSFVRGKCAPGRVREVVLEICMGWIGEIGRI